MSQTITYKGKVSEPSAMPQKENVISINKTDYYIFRPRRGNKGGNSWMLFLYSVEEFESAEEEYPDPEYAMKINKYSIYDNKSLSKKRNKRFKEEIDALYDCKESSYVIDIVEDGIIKDNDGSYLYYIMEAAEYDLKSYLENKPQLNKSDRLSICFKLTQAIADLFKNNYYHRDIKPDNFLLTYSGIWKIGDLGLVSERNIENDLDDEQEFIGPRGWTTPETMNKYLTKKKDIRFDRFIDEKSDMFQLGMVFWYIMQGNAPIGCVMDYNFLPQDHHLYIYIRTMLSYSKSLRPKDFESILKRLEYFANKALFE